VQLFTADGKIYWLIEAPANATPMGPFVNRDNYSGFIELVLPLALWGATRRNRGAWLYSIGSAIMYASVIAGQSRAGSILVSLEAVTILTIAFLSKRNVKTGTLTRVIVAATLILLFSSAVGWSDLLAKFDDRDPYGNDRRDFVQSSLHMVKDRPWFGFGLGTWAIAYPRYVVRDHGMGTGAAHNDWLQWAGEGGLLFVALMLIPALWGSWQSLRFPWGIGVIAVSLHATVDFPFRRYPTLLCFFLIIAAVLARDRRRPADRPDTEAELLDDDYSYRSALVGSIRLARSAGTSPARHATATKPSVDTTRVGGSWGARPKS
jgi:O-antigen ligase